jgi:hypothetical protein
MHTTSHSWLSSLTNVSGRRGSTQTIKRGLVWYTHGSKTNNGTGAGVYKWGLRRGHSFSLGFHTTVFQAEIYALRHV